MKICVTAQGNTLESLVDPRFGRAQYFIIYDTENDSFESILNPNLNLFSGAGIQSAQLIVQKGVQVLITGNVGPNAFNVLTAAGINIITGIMGVSVKEAIERFKRGELNFTFSPTVSKHFGAQMYPPNFGTMPYQFQTSKAQELNMLKQQLQFLKQQIEMINQRIKELEKNEQ